MTEATLTAKPVEPSSTAIIINLSLESFDYGPLHKLEHFGQYKTGLLAPIFTKMITAITSTLGPTITIECFNC